MDKSPGDDLGTTPFHLAATKGHLDMCKYIIESLGIKNPVNNDGDTPLHWAANNGHSDICSFIVEHVQDKNPLHSSTMSFPCFPATSSVEMCFENLC